MSFPCREPDECATSSSKTRSSKASRHIPEEMKARHPRIPWPKLRDIGSVLRHGYEAIDPAIIWSIIAEEFAPLKAAVAAMIAEVERGDGDSR